MVVIGTPGVNSEDGSSRAARCVSLRLSVYACGATVVLIHRQKADSNPATRKTGRQIRRRLSPAIRIEISSLSAERRPKVSRTAVSTPHGTV